jgi:hypothetical protein
MNWDAIGAIAELLGAIGVIASLVYLGRQIRDGQRALRASSYQQFRQDIFQTMNRGMTEPRIAQATRSGMANLAELDEEDAYQFGFWAHGVMHSYDNAYYQYRMGMLDDERWEMHRADVASLFTDNPGVVQWWRHAIGRSAFSAAFRALVEEILGEESER